jgi:hypothetical protein
VTNSYSPVSTSPGACVQQPGRAARAAWAEARSPLSVRFSLCLPGHQDAMHRPFHHASSASRRFWDSKPPSPAPPVISICFMRRKCRPHRCSIGNFGRGQKRRRGLNERAGTCKACVHSVLVVVVTTCVSLQRCLPIASVVQMVTKQGRLLAAPGFHRGVPAHHRQGSLSCQCRQPSVQGRDLGWKGR